jgi:hypothetical protein
MGQAYFKSGRLVKRVEVPWQDQRDAANFSVELSRWCKEQGLVDRLDYNWKFKPQHQVTVFYFEDHCESYATLFLLKWGGNEI